MSIFPLYFWTNAFEKMTTILDTVPVHGFQSSFLRLFTWTQPHIFGHGTNTFVKKNVFQHTLAFILSSSSSSLPIISVFFFFKLICVFSKSFLGNYQLHWSSFSLKFVVILLLSKWVVFHLLCTILLASFYTVQAGMSWGSVQAETVSLEPCLAHSIGQKLRKGSD